jgi:hypothetical protein
VAANPPADAPWLLLIYTVPPEPSRKRAFIWRELKKVGAVYLRDGVCVLPDGDSTAAAFRAIGARIEEFGGQATRIQDARLDSARADAIVDAARQARAQEYEEIAREAEQLLSHVQRETEHRDFTFAEVEELDADLGKLRRWTDQVNARDYFGAIEAERVEQLLRECDDALASFAEEASNQETVPP